MRRVVAVGAVVATCLLVLGSCSDDDGPIVVFDGQSLNNVPKPDFPALAMAGLDADGVNVAVNGRAWEQLAVDAGTRRDPYAKRGYAILVLVGGTSNVTGGEDGPTIHERMASYADSAREAGFRYVIATTIQPSTGESEAQNAAREEANQLILDDDDAFDEVVDLAGTPGLDDPAGPSYVDAIGHPSEEGARRMADAVRPAIERALEEADDLVHLPRTGP
jgi:hypothetical protein